jgi:hypothetical protein
MMKDEEILKAEFETPEIASYDREELDLKTALTAKPKPSNFN